jgi:homoserine dehydrogenase
VPANFNLISLEGSASGRQSLYGQGAGRYPTAYNVLQDCVDLLAGKGFYAPCGEKVRACNDHPMRFYVNASHPWLEEIKEEAWGNATVTKPVAVEAMHAWLKENPGVFVAAIAE